MLMVEFWTSALSVCAAEDCCFSLMASKVLSNGSSDLLERTLDEITWTSSSLARFSWFLLCFRGYVATFDSMLDHLGFASSSDSPTFFVFFDFEVGELIWT